ncbi:MAG: efflux RND transporter periplasmic adaptor subunit [Coriobacteriales bacterium]|nr:efflux RND transporter periplasmic adaptor subunit [Coriobacteriales bacterium]
MSVISAIQRPVKPKDIKHPLRTLVLVIIAVAIFIVTSFLISKLVTGSIIAPTSYETFVATPMEYSLTAKGSGKTDSAGTTVIAPEVDGTVEKVLVDADNDVAEGDILFTISSYEITQAQSKAQIDYETKHKEYTNAQELVEKKSDALDAANDALQKAKAKGGKEGDYRLLEAAVTRAQKEYDNASTSCDKLNSQYNAAFNTLEQCNTMVDKLTVKAPKEGHITKVNVKVGDDTRKYKDEEGAIQLVNADDLVAVVYIDAQKAQRMSAGLEADVTIKQENSTDLNKNASVKAVGTTPITVTEEVKLAQNVEKENKRDGIFGVIDSIVGFFSGKSSSSNSNDTQQESTTKENTYYEVTLAFDEVLKGIKMGSVCEATIDIKNYKKVYKVPETAVGQNEFSKYVKVLYVDGNTKNQPVSIIDTAEDGDLIVKGNYITEGMQICVRY